MDTHVRWMHGLETITTQTQAPFTISLKSDFIIVSTTLIFQKLSVLLLYFPHPSRSLFFSQLDIFFMTVYCRAFQSLSSVNPILPCKWKVSHSGASIQNNHRDSPATRGSGCKNSCSLVLVSIMLKISKYLVISPATARLILYC